MTKEVLLGAHMSIAGGAHMAIERAGSIRRHIKTYLYSIRQPRDAGSLFSS